MYNPNDYNDQMQAEAVSATRPPQFKESTCGYRCGWGCSEPDGGGVDSESDTAPTLVGYEDEAMEQTVLREEPDAFHPTDLRNNEVVDRDAGPIVLVDGVEEGLELSQYFFAAGIPMITPQMNWDYAESANSLEDQAGSETHSHATSDRRSIRSASPYGWTNEAGGWAKENKPKQLPGFFSMTPLRLSPQFEDCRGPVASHMVRQDLSTLLDIFGENWRGRMSINDWARSLYPELLTW